MIRAGLRPGGWERGDHGKHVRPPEGGGRGGGEGKREGEGGREGGKSN